MGELLRVSMSPFRAGTDLLVGGNLSIATDISNLTNGANIDVLADRNLTVGGSLALLTVATAEFSGTPAVILP